MGVDIGDDGVKAAQLSRNGKGLSLVAIGSETRPEHVEPGTSEWQRWAAQAVGKLSANGRFHGKEVIAALPAGDVFVEHVKVSKARELAGSESKLEELIYPKIKSKLPFDPRDTMTKYIPTTDDTVMVVATERSKIDRHLAIYERAGLKIKTLGIWPWALANSYISFFGRRQSDVDAIVMLLNLERDRTNMVICRHRNLLFARSIPVGISHLEPGENLELINQGVSDGLDGTSNKTSEGNTQMHSRLMLELTACRGRFEKLFKTTKIERLIFLSGQAADKDICAVIARQLDIPAQIGDCLVAINTAKVYNLGVDRRGAQVNWATAFGLSLECEERT